MAAVDPLGTNISACPGRAPRILLADPHRIVRQGVRALLEREGEFSVVGEAAGADEALALVDQLRPDAVVTELHLQEGSGLHLIEQTHARFPQIAIFVLTAFRARDRVASARRAGARGYLMKSRGRHELVAALRTTRSGRWYRSNEVADHPQQTRLNPDEANYASSRVAFLTSRQLQVLRLLALGYVTREIAERMGVSVQAVHRLRERLLTSLQLRGTAALTRLAIREGLIADAPPPASQGMQNIAVAQATSLPGTRID